MTIFRDAAVMSDMHVYTETYSHRDTLWSILHMCPYDSDIAFVYDRIKICPGHCLSGSRGIVTMSWNAKAMSDVPHPYTKYAHRDSLLEQTTHVSI